ncbi:MAG: CDP-diacylglycerol--glycerol-3-phosphate 3-phosphatidyltransferase [Phycisphaeraceae bacterium]|nr:MAG: CDP-diacylglycerol--glycerol-3-phosphate 3-phosphatidyltransferase [Phycisphaeraceae bacterium]
MHTPTPLQRKIPNALTIARIVMAAVFVALLSLYRFPDTHTWALVTAFLLFIAAALTDALDGYLARRWNAVSIFGRIADPFADKVLIIAAFVLLAGGQFTIPDSTTQASGILPWMVVVIIARELLVTTIRATLEARGIDFSASASGKWKMIAQSVGVPAILLILLIATWSDPDMPRWALLTNSAIAWGVVVITAWSALPYITRSMQALDPRK